MSARYPQYDPYYPTPSDFHLPNQLQSIIANQLLYPVFQPIFCMATGAVLGFEALIRGPQASELHSPERLFAIARQYRMLAALEYASRAVSCARFAELNLPGKLFLNMSPLSFTDSQYRDGVTQEILTRVGLNPERVVFELTESQPLDEVDLLKAASEHFQRQGFAIALDDLGAGYAGLKVWSELVPDYVKIDRHFISGIDSDPVKREFVRAMLEIAHRIGNKVIAEGIETRCELETLVSMGVELVQGFYLARPASMPVTELPTQAAELVGLHNRFYLDVFRRTLGEIAVKVETVTPNTSADSIVKMFRSDIRLACIPVVDGDNPLGMVHRTELLSAFSRPFAYELYAKKQIKEFISGSSLFVEADSELKRVAQQISDDPHQNLSLDLIVVKDKKFLGVAKVRHLLKFITEEKLRVAKYSNPLTELPGNVPLYEWIDQLLEAQTPFVACYVDINQFKPFNDAFGYSMGDEVILKLSNSLKMVVDPDLDFIGHVGGDDFVLIFRSRDWRERCHNIFKLFREAYLALVPAVQREYWSMDRQGNRQKYGDLTLAIGAITPDVTRCKTHHQVSLLLADAKKEAKLANRDFLFESRRRNIPLQESVYR